jgi:hypothetical protein
MAKMNTAKAKNLRLIWSLVCQKWFRDIQTNTVRNTFLFAVLNIANMMMVRNFEVISGKLCIVDLCKRKMNAVDLCVIRSCMSFTEDQRSILIFWKRVTIITLHTCLCTLIDWSVWKNCSCHKLPYNLCLLTSLLYIDHCHFQEKQWRSLWTHFNTS